MSDDEERRHAELSHSPLRAELAVYVGFVLGFIGSLPVCLILVLIGGMNFAAGYLVGMIGPPAAGLFAGLRYAFSEMPRDSRAIMRRCISFWACAWMAVFAGSLLPGLISRRFDLLSAPDGAAPLGLILLAAILGGLLFGVLVGVVRGFVAIRARLARKKREFENGIAVAADEDTARAALDVANAKTAGPPDESIRGPDSHQVAEGRSLDERR